MLVDAGRPAVDAGSVVLQAGLSEGGTSTWVLAFMH